MSLDDWLYEGEMDPIARGRLKQTATATAVIRTSRAFATVPKR
jgi:hypothetical protein